uniref:Uncharacterized protein n=1 Tax=Anguilla anguilla TaxID=7936 RepID=A0A0E9RGH0_ANGAN
MHTNSHTLNSFRPYTAIRRVWADTHYKPHTPTGHFNLLPVIILHGHSLALPQRNENNKSTSILFQGRVLQGYKPQ